VPSAGGVDVGESLALEPGDDLAQVVLAEAEAIGELLGREPLVVVGRLAVLLLGEKQVEGLLLGSGGHGDQRDRAHLHAGLDRALVELGLGHAMNLSIQRNGGGGQSALDSVLLGSMAKAAETRHERKQTHQAPALQHSFSMMT